MVQIASSTNTNQGGGIISTVAVATAAALAVYALPRRRTIVAATKEAIERGKEPFLQASHRYGQRMTYAQRPSALSVGLGNDEEREQAIVHDDVHPCDVISVRPRPHIHMAIVRTRFPNFRPLEEFSLSVVNVPDHNAYQDDSCCSCHVPRRTPHRTSTIATSSDAIARMASRRSKRTHWFSQWCRMKVRWMRTDKFIRLTPSAAKG